MNFITRCITIIAISSCAAGALARDDVKDFSIADALATEQAKNILGNNIKFYFGEQSHGAVTKKFGEFGTNRKTNGVGKSDKTACEWAFLSAMKALRERAQREGGNAIVNIRSNYRNATNSSTETFKCGAGNIIVGVALLGDVVEIK